MCDRDRLLKVYSNKLKEEIKIDPSIFDYDDSKILFIYFPLIEKLVIELIGLTDDINIEYKRQGEIRTINSLLDDNRVNKVLDEECLNSLKEIFADDGPRNKLFHQENNLIVTKGEIILYRRLIIELMEKYTNKLLSDENILFHPIEHV